MSDARSVRVAAGQEVVADFVATTGRLLRVSGTVRNSRGAPPAGHNVFLGVQTSNSSGQINGGAIAADGSFSVGNVPPGDYTLRVRQQGGGTADGEVAWMPISLSTEDLTGVQLTTQRGVTLRGRVEWAGSAPRPTTTMRVSTRLPPTRNSFHNFVPTGNSHWSALELSIFVSGGRAIQRCLSAPSLHNGCAGVNSTADGAIFFSSMSSYSPVQSRVEGSW